MKNVLMTASALAFTAGSAVAGGIERTTQSTAILFENADNYLEFSLGGFRPDVSGTVASVLPSGDMALGFGNLSVGYKHRINEALDFSLIYDQPIGANVAYPSGTGYPIAGSVASIDSDSLTALLKYKTPQNLSVFGGVRALKTSGTASLVIPLPSPPYPLGSSFPYNLKAGPETDFGYVLGVAWEKPEIAARVALTYNSKITHNFSDVEQVSGTTVPSAGFATTIPQSVNLEFQSGIAKDTLLFGSVRWVDWSAFDLTPPYYSSGDPTASPATGLGLGSLVDYTEDVVTYNLGIGRKFSENWSGAVTFGYEKNTGTPTGQLGPTDGYKSVGLAATYTRDNIKVTGGLRYVKIGDATTNPPLSGSFTDNSGVGAGIRIGYSF